MVCIGSARVFKSGRNLIYYRAGIWRLPTGMLSEVNLISIYIDQEHAQLDSSWSV